jgi:mitogen-activated protein kinase kinase 1
MPPKGRPVLEIAAPVEEPSGVRITDTLTLVVKSDGGVEMRVKESGIAGPASAKVTPAPAGSPSTGEAVLNKLKFEDLRIGPELGRGSQGKVRIVQHRGTLEKFAMKYLIFEGDIESQRMALQAELRQVEALKDANVVSSYEAFFRDGKLFILLEYMDCGTMKDIMRNHPDGIEEPKLAFIAREIMKGLRYLHESKVVHRDLKPANVLCNSKGEVKISDFGVAKQFQTDATMFTLSSQGSVAYMSPERIHSEPYSYSCDIWSVGVTIAELALGEYPFGGKKSVYDLCQVITASPVQILWERNSRTFSPELKDFVMKCLNPIASRPSASQLLEHPFLQSAKCVTTEEVGRYFQSTEEGKKDEK